MKYPSPCVHLPGYKWNRKKSLSKTDFKAMVDSILAVLFQRLARIVVLVMMIKAA
jgi:hypothetical protein